MVFFLLAVIFGVILPHFLIKKKLGALLVIMASVILVCLGAYTVVNAYEAPTIYEIKKIDYLENGWEDMGIIYAYDGYCYEDKEVVEGRHYQATRDIPVRFEKSSNDETYLVIYEISLAKRFRWANFGLNNRYEYLFITPDEQFLQNSN